MSDLKISLSNTTKGFMHLHWSYINAEGELKERSVSIHPYGLNYEIVFSSLEEKEKFLKEKEYLFVGKKLILGNQSDKTMNKEKESLDKIEETKAQSIQNESDASVEKQVEKITQGEIREFQTQVVKNQKKSK